MAAAGDPGRGRWDADALRDVVRGYAIEHLGIEDAVLAIDETGFPKQGKASCGVARRYAGSAGKVTNCQIGVFAAYMSAKGHAFVDRAPYLPRSWTADPARLPLMARLAPARLARHARLRDAGGHPHPRQRRAPKKSPDALANLIRWSVQEIRRIANRLARQRIEPRHVIAWSCWRRAHQAAAQHAHTQSRTQP